MKKILFFILAVILVVSSGVQTQAAELPFVPDGEETSSEVKEETKKEETTAVTNDSADMSLDSDKSNMKSDNIELPVEAAGDNTLLAVDDGIVIDNDKRVTVDNDKHLVIVDKDGKKTVIDDSQEYTENVNENG